MLTDMGALKALWQEAFGDPEDFTELFFRTGFSSDRYMYLEKDRQLAGALYWFDCLWHGKKLAYIYGVAVAKQFRGQGLSRQLMEITHKHLRESGYYGAVLVPAGVGLFSMYEKLGYRGFCPVEKRTVLPSTPVAVEQLDVEQYTALRRQSLPENGVLQEGATLNFLAGYNRLYSGQNCLLAAAQEEDTLYIQEFLGDAGALPGVVAALGAKSAKVRLPGGSKLFAMYLGFTEECQIPSYFGIALD